MPRDIVQELARRRLQELEKINDHADAEGQMYGAAPPVVRVWPTACSPLLAPLWGWRARQCMIGGRERRPLRERPRRGPAGIPKRLPRLTGSSLAISHSSQVLATW